MGQVYFYGEQCMENLIKSWEILAESYYEKGQSANNSYTAERLFASAETLQVCADQLKRAIKLDPSNQKNMVDKQ